MIDTKAYKQAMGNIYKEITGEKQFLEENGISLQGASENENIDDLIHKTRGTSFKLLVMGEFSSGKSAFINVLLGEKLLPEGAVPMTALITEINYGREKKVVMYPRPGKWRGGDKPFEIEPKLSEIKKYSTIDNKSGINMKEANRVDSSFEKMVVHWPLEILKDGVAIVDSPGLNDPYSNDYIVQKYVPKADAILFCVNGTKAYSAGDKKTLELINSSGFKNPIMVTTYFDVVTDEMSQQEIQEFMDICNAKYMNHTEKAFCHYVNSKLGMEAKQTNSQSSLVESGYYELEKFLATYLTENKGREKIGAATSAIKAYNAGQKKKLSGVLANLDAPDVDFNKRIEETKKKLDNARKQGEQIVREFKLELKGARNEVKTQLIPKLYEDIYNNVNLDDFEPDTDFTVFHPKQSSQQIAEECSKELEIRNKQFVADWNNKVLVPMITRALKEATANMKRQFDTFSEDIQSANLALETKASNVDTDVSTGTRVAMIGWALLTGDWITALMGGVFGAGGFGRMVVCNFAANMVLLIVGLFTPVGLAGIVIVYLGALIGGAAWNASSAAANIKKNVVKEMRKSLAENKEKIIAQASDKCMEIFDGLEQKLQQAVNDDIAEVEENIRTIERERKDNESQVSRRKNQIANIINYIDTVDAKMDSIRASFQIQ